MSLSILTQTHLKKGKHHHPY